MLMLLPVMLALATDPERKTEFTTFADTPQSRRHRVGAAMSAR